MTEITFNKSSQNDAIGIITAVDIRKHSSNHSLDPLNKREKQCLILFLGRFSIEKIAEILYYSPRRIKQMLASACDKLRAWSFNELFAIVFDQRSILFKNHY